MKSVVNNTENHSRWTPKVCIWQFVLENCFAMLYSGGIHISFPFCHCKTTRLFILQNILPKRYLFKHTTWVKGWILQFSSEIEFYTSSSSEKRLVWESSSREKFTATDRGTATFTAAWCVNESLFCRQSGRRWPWRAGDSDDDAKTWA